MQYPYNSQQFQASGMMPQMQQQQAFQSPQYAQMQMDRLSQLQQEAAQRDAMFQQQMLQQQQLMSQPAQQQGPRLVPVGSIDEAKGYLSPTNGERVYFLNSSNNEIYSKQLDFATGKSIFSTYRLIPENSTAGQNQQAVTATAQETSKEVDMSKYVSKDDYDTLKKDYSELKTEFNKFKAEFKEMWGEPTKEEK